MNKSIIVRSLIITSLVTTFTACSNEEETTVTSSAQKVTTSAVESSNKTAVKQQAETEKLYQLFSDHDEANMKLNPIMAVFRGDMRYNDQFGDYMSDEYLAESKALDEQYLQAISTIDETLLNTQDKASARIFKYNRETALESFEKGIAKKGTLLPVSQFFSIPSFMLMLGSGSAAQPFKTVEDYENWIKRAKGYTNWTEAAIKNMNQGIAEGIVQPKVIMEKALPQITAQVVDDPEQSLFYTPIRKMPEDFSAEDKERLTAEYKKLISEDLVPAYKKLATYLEKTYLPNTRETIGLSSLPGGKEWYEYQAKINTTTDYTPEQIHNIGKQEAERLFAEMHKVKDQVGFKGDIQEFFNYLRTDPKFYYDNAEELLAEYESIRQRVNSALPDLFNIMPKADYEVRPVPEHQERTMAAAYYQPPSPDGARPGVFYANTYDLKARPKYTMEALSIHEANPGHHFQIAISMELEKLPNFRRFGGFTAYIEGWGLYSESLGKDLGMYTDPYQYFGALTFNIWRANRLVVDTGMHYLGWSREQAIDWMKSNAPLSDTDIISEVDRYIAVPGQALGYKIGELKIQELRKRSESELGDKFDIKEFHSQILGDGALPLEVLDAKINDWITAVKNG